jgi:DNA-binding response OmpR family regulator
MHALVVEPDAAVRHLLRLHLELGGFQVHEARDGRAGLERLRARPFDVVVLSDDPPGIDGLTLCRAIRAQGPNRGTAIVLLSTRTGESDKVTGLASGADDYVTKPFGVRELLARLAALLRRTRDRPAAVEDRQLLDARISLDLSRREAFVRGRRVALTRQEFDVLHHLAARPGMVFSRRALLLHVWNDDRRASERTVDVAISRLRRKIECNPRDPEVILTAWGVGYKFAADVARRIVPSDNGGDVPARGPSSA